MKLSAFSLVALLSANVALADGFVCSTLENDLTVKVFDNTQPEAGTLNAAVLVLSDPAVSNGRKTIARFTDVNGTLSNTGASYFAKVDLRFADSRRKGELILGTKLGQLHAVELNVHFSYATPIEDGETTPGYITLLKRNGEEVQAELVCSRYLKGSN